MALPAPPPPEPKHHGGFLFLPSGALGVSPFRLLDQAFFLRMFDRQLPADYLESLRTGGNGGYEIFRALARVGERASEAVINSASGLYIGWATLGAAALGEVELYRQSANNGRVLVKAGTVVRTDAHQRFVLKHNVLFDVGDLGPHTVPIEATLQGWDHNVPGQATTAGGETIPGAISTIETLLEEPAFGDPTIQVRQIAATYGGRAPMLESLGYERGVAHQDGEDQEPYRIRVRQIGDTVSPDAIHRLVYNYLQKFGSGFVLIEPWRVTYQTCWSAPSVAYREFNPTVFVWNDPRLFAEVGFRGRWLSADDDAGGVIVVVENLAFIAFSGFCFDDSGISESDHATPTILGGYRAWACFDMPLEAPAEVALSGFDGFDSARRAAYLGLYEQLQRIKLAGVSVTLEIEES